MSFNPHQLATLYYFGELQYWKLPKIAADALSHGLDGPSLRRLAGLENPVLADISQEQIDAGFREMGVEAPIPKEKAILTLAKQTAQDALAGRMNVFDAATHIRIYLCDLNEPPPPLRRVVSLSKEAKTAPRDKWEELKRDLTDAMREFGGR